MLDDIATAAQEVCVDWIKHAFVTKFNKVEPEVYDRYRDVIWEHVWCFFFLNFASANTSPPCRIGVVGSRFEPSVPAEATCVCMSLLALPDLLGNACKSLGRCRESLERFGR